MSGKVKVCLGIRKYGDIWKWVETGEECVFTNWKENYIIADNHTKVWMDTETGKWYTTAEDVGWYKGSVFSGNEGQIFNSTAYLVHWDGIEQEKE